MNYDPTIFDALKIPRYTPVETLNVTRLKPETLQTWVNREVVKLAEQNPGRGKRRMYSAIDIVKLAIMRRCDDLKLALSTAVDIAEGVEEEFRKGYPIEWDTFIFLRPRSEENRVTIISSGGRLSKYGLVVGDARNMRVSDFVEQFEGVISRRSKSHLGDPNYSSNRPIDPERREALARQGLHSEPVIIFPLGEIVNGALAQLREINEVG